MATTSDPWIDPGVDIGAKLPRIDGGEAPPAFEEQVCRSGRSGQRSEFRDRLTVSRHGQDFTPTDPIQHIAATISQVPNGDVTHDPNVSPVRLRLKKGMVSGEPLPLPAFLPHPPEHRNGEE